MGRENFIRSLCDDYNQHYQEHVYIRGIISFYLFDVDIFLLFRHLSSGSHTDYISYSRDKSLFF